MTARRYLKRHSASSASISAASCAAFMFAVVCLATQPRAYAQSADANRLFDDGAQLMSQGNLEQACQAFEASNRIEPRAGTLILLGECRERNQQLASAWSAYTAALTRVKTSSYRELAEARAAALEPRLSYLTVSVPEASRVYGLIVARNGESLDSTSWNLLLPIDGGDYVITARAPGHEDWEIKVHAPVGHGQISVEVPRLKKPSEATPMSTAPPAPQPASTSTSRPAPPLAAEAGNHNAMLPNELLGRSAASRPTKVAPLLTAAGTVVVLGSALGLELLAESKYAAARSETTNQVRRDSLYDSANTIRQVAATFAASGLVAGGVAVWLYQRYRRQDRERGAVRRISVNMVPAGAGLAVLGRF
jgi:hypothetical protein